MCHSCTICNIVAVFEGAGWQQICAAFSQHLVTVFDSDTVAFLQYSPLSRTTHSFPELIYSFIPLHFPPIPCTCSLIHLLICNWFSLLTLQVFLLSLHLVKIFYLLFFSFPTFPKKGGAKRSFIKHFKSESRRYSDSVSRKSTKFCKFQCVISVFGI
jgi:hypothetical protein